MDRRKLLQVIGIGTLGLGLISSLRSSLAAEVVDESISAGINAAIADAQNSQFLNAEAIEDGLPSSNDYDTSLFPMLVAIDKLEASPSSDPRRRLILDQLYASLARLNEIIKEDQGGDGEEAAPNYGSLRDSYAKLFETCVIDGSKKNVVNWYVSRLKAEKSIVRYRKIEQITGVPWYFVGIVHGLEASFNFRGHLHNGDPLTDRTFQVPRGRPKMWNPPSDWESSAVDALSELSGNSDWSLPRMLYVLEGYNGYGYHAHQINSPYLWSFSNQYSAGKYVQDGKWSATAVSKQCGAAVMLKSLSEQGIIKF